MKLSYSPGDFVSFSLVTLNSKIFDNRGVCASRITGDDGANSSGITCNSTRTYSPQILLLRMTSTLTQGRNNFQDEIQSLLTPTPKLVGFIYILDSSSSSLLTFDLLWRCLINEHALQFWIQWTHCSRMDRYSSFIAQDFFHFSSLINNGDNLNM